MQKKILIILLVFLFPFFGAIITIISKYLDTQESLGKSFSHFWFFNLLMFLSEMLAIPLYYIIACIKKKCQKNSEEQKEIYKSLPEKKITFLLFIPSILDTIATLISNIGLFYLPGGLYTMLKGLTIIIVTILISKYILKNKHTWDHYIAIPTAFIGFIFSGLSAFYGVIGTKSNNNGEDNILIGIPAVVISMVFQSAQFSFEENYMRKYCIHPFLCIGIEGLFGFIFNLILCIIFYFKKLSEEPKEFFKKLCNKDDGNDWRVENIIFAFQQINENEVITIFIIVFFICIFPNNLFGITINKYGGALNRSFIENLRSFLVWLYFLCVDSEELHENFNYLRLLGMIFILASILIYIGLFKIDEKILIRRKIKTMDYIDDINEEIVSRSDFSYNSDA